MEGGWLTEGKRLGVWRRCDENKARYGRGGRRRAAASTLERRKREGGRLSTGGYRLDMLGRGGEVWSGMTREGGGRQLETLRTEGRTASDRGKCPASGNADRGTSGGTFGDAAGGRESVV